jgi:hypothetical protein
MYNTMKTGSNSKARGKMNAHAKTKNINPDNIAINDSAILMQ